MLKEENLKLRVCDIPSKFIALEKRDLPLLSLLILFKIGAVNDPSGKSGLAHFLEHMMFNGSEKFPAGEFDRILESAGGYSNAFTAYDYTGYYEVFPSSKLEKVLELELDRLNNLIIEEEILEKEKKVVLEERKLTVENDSKGLLEETLGYISFFNHPYRRPIIGTNQELKRITVWDLKDLYRFYSPENAVVVLAGDVELDYACKKLERFAQLWGNKGRFSKWDFEMEDMQGRRTAIVKKSMGLDAYMAAFKTPAPGNIEEFISLLLLPYIISETLSARIRRVLVEEKRIASQFESWYDPRVEISLFYLYAEASKGVTGERLGEELIKELNFLKESLEDEEFEIARTRFILDERLKCQRVEELAELIALGEIFWNDPYFYFSLLDRVKKLDKLRFLETINAVVCEDNLSEVILKNV
ncbi:MAG: insulinase family protein [Candidatus Aminicenantes bacterium]|nr:insulinase family protein [Candidatus Aminicenantes bacterium]